MDLNTYRIITGVKFDNAVSGGTDGSTDSGRLPDPNNMVTAPLNQKHLNFIFFAVLIFVIIKQFN